MTAKDEILKIRAVIRKDLESVGMIPTGAGIGLVAGDDMELAMSLYCEAIYVFLYNGKSLEEIAAYVEGPLQLDPEMGGYVIRSAFRVRSALEESDGDHNKAFKELMGDAGARESLIKILIQTCISTAREFNIPWNKKYSAMLNEFLNSSNGFPWGCLAILTVLGVLVYFLISWIF